jgi:hypothetical protein
MGMNAFAQLELTLQLTNVNFAISKIACSAARIVVCTAK